MSDVKATASKKAKESGLKSLTQVSELSGRSLQTLTNWFNNDPALFNLVLLGCKAKSNEKPEEQNMVPVEIPVTILVIYYEPDTTQEREDGCPMEIEFTAKIDKLDVSDQFSDTQVEKLFLEVVGE